MSTARTTAAWIIPLVGHQNDLEELPLYLEGSAVHVVKREDTYYLVIPTEIGGEKPELVRGLAVEHLARINGASILSSDSFRPVALGERLYGIDANGQLAATVIECGTGEFRSKGLHAAVPANGLVAPDHRSGAVVHLMRAAAASTPVADALAILGRPKPTWSELFVVYELIQSNGGNQMVALGWIRKADEERFCRTVNSRTALGRDARHGRDVGQPPSNPMTQPEAITIIRALAVGWLRHITS